MSHRDPVQVRGLFAERVVISTMLDPFLGLRALSAYSGLSTRTLRAHIDRPSSEALPCYRVAGGKILVRRGDFDKWVKRYCATGKPSLARAMHELGIA